MYDQNALDLINTAPHFGEIDFDQLPKDFTKAYTLIVSARLRHQNMDSEADTDIEELVSLRKEVSRIAHTYEAYVLLQSERDNRQAAAFLAASAHNLLSEVSTLAAETYNSSNEVLSDFGIDRKLSAAFMYFLSNYTADAIEMVKKVQNIDSSTPRGRLLTALHQLLTGQIGSIDENIPYYPSTDEWSLETASNTLWAHLHEGVNILLQTLTYEIHDSNAGFNRALSIFERVIELSSSNEEIEISDINVGLVQTYVGQKYLATLLKNVAAFLPEIALISLNIPTNTNQDNWQVMLATFTRKRPYLWPNHLNAIESGYLNQGVSSVISFPTGGGKSTLSELKIATSLLRHESVIFLAPTLALVDQVAKSLKEAFPTVQTSISFDEFGGSSIDFEELPDISVMTPESCLVKMSFSPEMFSEVGLFIFDECHLLHSKDSSDIVNRRSLDAMLCLMKIITLSTNTDLLLMSAMLSNGGDLAEWLSGLLDRTVLSLDLSWKPTRQAKGCVVYSAAETENLVRYVRDDASRTASGRLTAAAKRELTATPFGFFSLNQTWHSGNIRDYKLTKFLDSPVLLGVNNYNQLTANRNQVAASLAKASTNLNIKTLIFTSTRRESESIVTTLNQDNQNSSTTLTEFENKLYGFVLSEFGGEDFTYFTDASISLPHHGLLLKEERLLHEALFKRSNSMVDALIATSTLAQGINLPAEYVIIAGDTRFDQETSRQQTLDAHELLNAAGRAGRAGQNANGLVLVIPSKVISFDPGNRRITRYFNNLKSIFEQSDQCLVVEDPIGHVLDRIQAHESIDAADIKYFIQSISPVNVSSFVSKSFRAFIERRNGHENWISERIETVQESIERMSTEEENSEDWQIQLSSVSGISVDLIQLLHDVFIFEISESTINNPFNVLEWFFTWLCESFTRANSFIRMQTMDEEIGNEFSSMNNHDKLSYIRDRIGAMLALWMRGIPLNEIEISFGTNPGHLNKCLKARRFVIRIVPELAYATSVLMQIYKYHVAENPADRNLYIELLPQMIRLGFDNPQKLALHYILKDETCRTNTHSLFNSIASDLSPIDNLDFNQVMANVRSAYVNILS